MPREAVCLPICAGDVLGRFLPPPDCLLSLGRLLRAGCMVTVLAATWQSVQAQSVAFGLQPVTTVSGEKNVPVTARAAGTVSTVEVLTLGSSGLDFGPGIGAMTCAAATLSIGQSCTESVTFTPGFPGLRTGAVVLLDGGGNVVGVTYLSGVGVGGLGVLVGGNLLPVAGDGIATGPVLDGETATSASLDLPAGVALDGAGNLYIADTGHNRMREVSAAAGLISTLAGNGSAGYAGDGLASTSTAVSLSAPNGVAVDGAGNVYIADTGNNVVREIAASTGTIATVTGTGARGKSGDGGAATAALLNQPRGVSVDANGNLYIADTANHRVRRVDAVTGIISTTAGNGTTNPSTGAGGYAGDGGAASLSELNLPYAVAFDAAGNLFIADSGNNVVRVVAAAGGMIAPSSLISTFAGTGTVGDSGDGGAAVLATLSSPSGIAADAAGNVLIADTQNASVRTACSEPTRLCIWWTTRSTRAWLPV